MDNKSIDQILSSFNNNDDISSLVVDLQHRTPSIRTIPLEIYKPDPIVKIPVDPTTSVSSTENTVIHEIPPQSTKTKSKTIQVGHKIKKSNETNGDYIDGKKIQKTSINNVKSNDSITTTHIESDKINVPSHLTTIFGYSIPTTTLYFIIILAIIAIALYFLTAEKKKSSKEKEADDKE